MLYLSRTSSIGMWTHRPATQFKRAQNIPMNFSSHNDGSSARSFADCFALAQRRDRANRAERPRCGETRLSELRDAAPARGRSGHGRRGTDTCPPQS